MWGRCTICVAIMQGALLPLIYWVSGIRFLGVGERNPHAASRVPAFNGEALTIKPPPPYLFSSAPMREKKYDRRALARLTCTKFCGRAGAL